MCVGGGKEAGVFFSCMNYIGFDPSAAQTDVREKIKEGKSVKSKKALTSSRNFISCTTGARRRGAGGREGKRRE